MSQPVHFHRGKRVVFAGDEIASVSLAQGKLLIEDADGERIVDEVGETVTVADKGAVHITALESSRASVSPDVPSAVTEADATHEELYAEAQEREIAGRSTMTKAELRQALRPGRSNTADKEVGS